MMRPNLPCAAGRVVVALAVACFLGAGGGGARAATVEKVGDIVIYKDDRFYSAFPSIVLRPDGEMIVAFRRAPERRMFGEKGSSHTDPNSYLVLVRSPDGGATWTEEPELIYAHPFGGSQDPCMVQLADGSIVCTSYAWARLAEDAAAKIDNSLRHGPFVFLGGYVLRSEDGGRSWRGPFTPPPLEGNQTHDAFGRPVPVYNRGAMCQTRDGRLQWVIAYQNRLSPRLTSTHLMTSEDRGETWTYACPVAEDEKASFNETSLIETPSGDLVAFMRTADFGDHTVVARSTDGGRSFGKWEDAGWRGHPHHALRLPGGETLLVYGYRHKPFGIRARVLDAECSDFREAEEIVLRDDGGSGDLGYPWASMTPEGDVLVTYYFNRDGGTRHIAGTILKIVP